LTFSSDFCKSYQVQIAQEVTFRGSRTDTGERTDRQTDTTNLIGAFRNVYVTMPKNSARATGTYGCHIDIEPTVSAHLRRKFPPGPQLEFSSIFVKVTKRFGRSALMYSECTVRHSSFHSVQRLFYLSPLVALMYRMNTKTLLNFK
jgi:hypothetical protein